MRSTTRTAYGQPRTLTQINTVINGKLWRHARTVVQASTAKSAYRRGWLVALIYCSLLLSFTTEPAEEGNLIVGLDPAEKENK